MLKWCPYIFAFKNGLMELNNQPYWEKQLSTLHLIDIPAQNFMLHLLPPQPQPTSILFEVGTAEESYIWKYFLSYFHCNISKNYFEKIKEILRTWFDDWVKNNNIYNSPQWRGIEKVFLLLLSPKLVINCNSQGKCLNGTRSKCGARLQRRPAEMLEWRLVNSIPWTDGNVWSFIYLFILETHQCYWSSGAALISKCVSHKHFVKIR